MVYSRAANLKNGILILETNRSGNRFLSYQNLSVKMLRNNDTIIYTLWTCDAWIASKSFSLKGIFSSKEKAIDTAKTKKLLQKDTYVVIYAGVLDNYDDTEQKIFSTEFSQDKSQLTN